MIRVRKAVIFGGVLSALLVPHLSFGQDVSATWSFEDQRPASELKQRGVPGSINIMSCNYGISIMDDRGQIEPRTVGLQRVLEQTLGRRLSGKKVIVKRYLVSWNGGALDVRRHVTCTLEVWG